MATKPIRKPAAKRPAAKALSAAVEQKVAAKPAAKAKAPKAKDQATKAARLDPATKITIIAKEAPALRGSRAERWALVKSGMTVAELAAKLKAGGYSVTGGAMANWLASAGLVKLG